MVRGWAGTGVLAGGAVAGLLLAAGPAAAHVDVSADNATAGAANSVLTFAAASESETSGITALRVVLPMGIRPADVSWVSGPDGWVLTRGTDGYAVSGQPLPPGRDVRYSVRIRQLPTDADELAFKTLQNYQDGRVDRWIEEPVPGGAQPENPAPVLTLAAARPGAPGSPGASPTPSTSVPAARPSSSAAPAQDRQEAGTPPLAWLLLAVVGAAAVGGLWWLWRRRRI